MGAASVAILAALFSAGLMVALVVATSAAPASAAVNQCNGIANVGGQEVDCTVTIINNLNLATGVATSTVTTQVCTGAAGAPTCAAPTTTTSGQLTTSVNQCNGTGDGGGSTVKCTVTITNNITGTASTTGATVNQCNGSGTGGGTQPTVNCDPFPASTTNATITQCNSSGNGGGGTMRVTCTVGPSTQTSALPVTVNQCNNSGNGGGGTVTCSTSITTNIITPPTSTTSTSTPTSTTLGGMAAGVTGAGGGSGSAGGGAGAASGGGSLAFTGLNSLWASLCAVMLVLMGAALVQFSRPGSAHAMSLRQQLASNWGRRIST